MPLISLKVKFPEPAEYERLKEFCGATDRAMAVVVRRAVAEYLDRQAALAGYRAGEAGIDKPRRADIK